MKQFDIKVARIEAVQPTDTSGNIRLTFHFERGPLAFDLPLLFRSDEFDDTEIVRVARSRLSEVFLQLAAQCEDWRLTNDELRLLGTMNLHPDAASHRRALP